MKKVIIGILVAIILVGVGVSALLIFSRKQTREVMPPQDQKTTTQEETSGFTPVAMEGLAFEATIAVNKDGSTTNAIMKFDSAGNSEYITGEGKDRTRIIYTKDAYYTCNETQGCFRFEIANGETGVVDPTEYQYSEKDFRTLRQTATYKAQEKCPAGTCDVWEANDEAAKTVTTLYLDTSTKRISKVVITNQADSSTVEYEYKNVTIEVPADAEELPAGI